jgi:hypothetical protein
MNEMMRASEREDICVLVESEIVSIRHGFASLFVDAPLKFKDSIYGSIGTQKPEYQ